MSALLPVGELRAWPPVSPPDCVILLHGLARTSSSMKKMQLALESDGYRVANESYPSREYPIETLAPLAIDAGLQNCATLGATGSVHFVTHSLGGILVRQYLANQPIERLGRVVMLGPPNKGSIAADKMRILPGFEIINGPAGKQLGKGRESVPLSLKAPDFEFAVIAGSQTIDPITSAILTNPDDGKVSVEDTKLAGMSDFALVKVSHAFIMKNEQVIGMVKNFLHFGRLAI